MSDEEEQDVYRKEYYNPKAKESDYEYSRRIYLDIIANGAEAVEEAMRVAKETEHPRAYEVLSKLIKDVGDTNEKLLGLHKQQKDLDKEDTPLLPPGADGSTFILTTDALQRMMLDQNKEKDVTPKT